MNIENILNQGISILKENKIPNTIVIILLSESINKDIKHIILNSKEILNNNKD